jgi:antitoxin component YwqK of YwqJK toxin-antitoxin module
MNKLLLLTFSFLTIISYSQNRISKESSIEIITKAYELQTEEKYEDAIAEYAKINLNDTNYAAAQYESGSCYIDLKKYSEARSILNDLLNSGVKFKFQHDVYSSIGYSFMKEGDSLSALKTFNEGLAKYPMDFRLYFNRGSANEALGNYQEAYHDYLNSIQRNIYFEPSHYRLAMLAANEEHYSEATLSLLTYLLINPNANSAGAIISLLENIADGTFNPKPKNITFSESNPFESINLLFKNRVALEKKYKTKFTIPGAFPNQLHFIVNNVKYDANDNDFWNQYYLPLFLQINQENKLDQLVMLSLVSIENESIQKKLKANITKIKSFLDWVNPLYTDKLTQQNFTFEGETKKMYMSYEKKRLATFGELDEENRPKGYFHYYHTNGSLMLIAKYENGEPVDKLEYFSEFNGKKYKEIEFTSGGKGNKIERIYYPSGELKESTVYKSDVVVDTVYEYYRNGTVLNRIAAADNKRNGESTTYYANGSIHSKGNYKLGKEEGVFEYYHRNGKIESTVTYVNGMREGKILSYYPDGVLASSYEVKTDKYNGPYEEFYPNGKLKQKGSFKNGSNVGELTFYYSNGVISNTTTLDQNGKENGSSILYDLDGKKYHEIDYVAGDIRASRFYDKAGQMKLVSEKKGKKINYQLYYPSGVLNIEGKFEDGKREGKWTYFDKYGNVSKTENYKLGEVNDTVVFYHETGSIREQLVYKDGVREGMYLEKSIYGNLTEEGYFKNDYFDRERFTYYENGTISSELFFIDGSLSGIQKYYAANGKIKMLKEFEDGELIRHNYFDTLGNEMDVYGQYNGIIELHDPTNSYVNYRGTFLNGESNGEQVFLTPDKVITSKGSFSNNNKIGKWQWYHRDGKISEEATYLNDEITGVNTEYYSNGKPSFVGNFLFGEGQGDFKRYHENGKVQMEGTLLDGERHGIITSYAPDGSVVLIRNYNMGIIMSHSYMGADGKPVAFIPVSKDSDSIVTYHTNKKVAMRSKRVNGLVEGLYLTYYENGQIFEKENYLHGSYHGLALNYFQDGKVSYECNYQYGLKNGVEKKFYANGKLKSEQSFLNGTAHGPLKEYSIEGKLISTTTFYDGEIISIKR